MYNPENYENGNSSKHLKNGEKNETINNQKTFNTFALLLISKKKPVGGNDDIHNDCLFKAIKKGLNEQTEMTGLKLKNKLKLKRNDKIDIKNISECENIFKCNINVVGDCKYLSKMDKNLTVNLKLVNSQSLA